MKPKTRLENGVRVNIADNTLATASSSAQADRLASGVTAPTAKPITVSDLSNAPTVASLVPQTPSTAATGMLGEIQSNTDQFTANLAKESERAGQMEQSSFETYLKSQLDAPTTAELESDLYKKEVDPLQKEVTGLNNQLLSEQRSLENKIRDIEKNPQGLFGGALTDAIDDARTESLRRQADISVILTAKTNSLADARAVADRAVDAITARNKQKVDILGQLYQRNANLFDKSEQRAFESAQNDRQRTLQEQADQKKAINDVALTYLSEGGSASGAQAIMGAKTLQEAVGKTGGVIGQNARIQNAINQAKYTELKNAIENPPTGLDADTREAIGKSDITKQAVTQISLVKNLSELRSLIKEHGTKNIVDTEAAGKIAALRSQLEIDIAVAGGQGAISGDEAARYANIVGGGFTDRQSKVLSQLDQAISTNNGKIKSGIGLLEATYEGAGNFEPFVEYINDVELQDFLDNELEVKTPQQTKAEAITNWLTGGKI